MSQSDSKQHPAIHQADIYPSLDREQWTGYCTGFVELDGERVTFTSIESGFEKPEGGLIDSYQTSETAAWKAFDLGLRDWLKDKPGIVLWRREPVARSDDERVVDEFAARGGTVWDEAKGEWRSSDMIVTRKRWYIGARVAVTQNRAFVDPSRVEASIAPPPRIPA